MTAPSDEGSSTPVELVIYSPAPANNMLHALNQDLGRAIQQHLQGVAATVVPVALPDSINTIAERPEAEKRHHLPIVTSVDFLPARDMTGVAWHAYHRANTDLKLVAALYDVAFGVLALDTAIVSPAGLKGKRIGVPPRPSSFRVISEALLRDAWGLLDDVELVDLRPNEVVEAVATGRIHATTWNFMSRTRDGFAPLLPELTQGRPAHWLGVSAEQIAAINQANAFHIDGVLVPAASIRIEGADQPLAAVTWLSMKQGLAAWDSTENATVASVLQCLLAHGIDYPGLPDDLTAMLDWPALDEAQLHPGALAFFRRHGVAFQRRA